MQKYHQKLIQKKRKDDENIIVTPTKPNVPLLEGDLSLALKKPKSKKPKPKQKDDK